MGKLTNLIKDGVMSYKFDLDGHSKSPFLVFFNLFLVPLAFVIFAFIFNVSLKDGIDTILAAVSIFTAFTFGTLFIAPDRFSQRVELLRKHQGEDFADNYIIRFENFSKRYVKRICLSSFLGLLLIILLPSQKIFANQDRLYIILNYSNIFLLALLIMISISILKDIYSLLIDDIKTSNKVYLERNKKERD